MYLRIYFRLLLRINVCTSVRDANAPRRRSVSARRLRASHDASRMACSVEPSSGPCISDPSIETNPTRKTTPRTTFCIFKLRAWTQILFPTAPSELRWILVPGGAGVGAPLSLSWMETSPSPAPAFFMPADWLQIIKNTFL